MIAKQKLFVLMIELRRMSEDEESSSISLSFVDCRLVVIFEGVGVDPVMSLSFSSSLVE
jgi:hypothetical protein